MEIPTLVIWQRRCGKIRPRPGCATAAPTSPRWQSHIPWCLNSCDLYTLPLPHGQCEQQNATTDECIRCSIYGTDPPGAILKPNIGTVRVRGIASQPAVTCCKDPCTTPSSDHERQAHDHAEQRLQISSLGEPGLLVTPGRP